MMDRSQENRNQRQWKIFDHILCFHSEVKDEQEKEKILYCYWIFTLSVEKLYASLTHIHEITCFLYLYHFRIKSLKTYQQAFNFGHLQEKF